MINIQANGTSKDGWQFSVFDLYEDKDIPLVLYNIRKYLEDNEICEIKINMKKDELPNNTINKRRE